ncbi:uncharacterized protein LOC128491854 [Spea bombifrons]|uniref:uncharacterized protein LOC128491854 n=1 Tax=Spea bombifrons TaxID=233779 RepID=UPI00234A5296|nr:uncharacterized protein LOC128491854 [Spea bombifrons]
MSSNKGLQAISHPNQLPATPSMTKRLQIQQRNTFRSPTDNLISPCSLRLRKAKIKAAVSDQDSNGKKMPKCDEKENALS